MFIKSRYLHSTVMVLSGCSGIEKRGAHPNLSKIFCLTCDVKFVPSSERIIPRMPVLVKMLRRASQVAFGVSDRKHTNSGQRVEA
ncbi:hypothetical protein HPB48_023353 [Haemaphysalis longicornis]|uniref:Uncharacterized protein n=1 Tax=Haemaphysalis longicornis TaxID=44386 RepID=A0A9J6GWD2_HAELO|nr:hypothetical protein HPB48_023353 [Haemaphysalis longicornis]